MGNNPEEPKAEGLDFLLENGCTCLNEGNWLITEEE